MAAAPAARGLFIRNEYAARSSTFRGSLHSGCIRGMDGSKAPDFAVKGGAFKKRVEQRWCDAIEHARSINDKRRDGVCSTFHRALRISECLLLCRRWRWSCWARFDAELDLHFIAHHCASAFHGAIPAHVIIHTVDLEFRRGAENGAACRLQGVELEGQLDLFGDVFHREITDRHPLVSAL